MAAIVDLSKPKLRRWFVCVVLVCAMTAAVGYPYLQSSRPNVILVTFDTTRADHLGAYGYEMGLTAAFDDFAKSGVTFESAYASAPLTLPSHATMLTGLYPPEHGLRVNGGGRLTDEIPLLPEILKKQGYETGAFVAAFVLDSKFGLGRGFDIYDDDLSGTAAAAHSVERRREGQSVVDAALQWLTKRNGRPFFCWIHLYDAHGEYDARPKTFGERFQLHPYDAGIAVEIEQFGRVLKFLRDQQLDRRTVVVVAGDHGEGLNDHAEHEHGLFVYNTTVRVPLVIAGADDCLPGHRVTDPVSLVDLTPTLLDLLKIAPPKHVSGRSLRTALSGKPLSPRPCYAETEEPFLDNRWCPLQTVITDRWKYIQTTKKELYDLQNDPNEGVNLVESAVEQQQEMQSLLEVIQESFVLARSDNVNLSDKDLAALTALGYVAGAKTGAANASEGEVLADMKDMLPYSQKLMLARHLFAEGKIDETIALAGEIIESTDKCLMAHILLGDAQRRQGRFDEAEVAYRSVLEKQPDHPIAHAHLGTIFGKRGEFARAAEEFRQVIAKNPEAAQSHFDLAEMLIRLQKYDDAVSEFREATRSDPGFVFAHFQQGLLLANLQRHKEAIDCFEQAIKYSPGFAIAHSNLGLLLMQTGQKEKSLVHAKKAVELEPQSFQVQFNLGTILVQQKRYEEALVPLREAQKLQPDDPRVVTGIRQLEILLQQAGKSP